MPSSNPTIRTNPHMTTARFSRGLLNSASARAPAIRTRGMNGRNSFADHITARMRSRPSPRDDQRIKDPHVFNHRAFGPRLDMISEVFSCVARHYFAAAASRKRVAKYSWRLRHQSITSAKKIARMNADSVAAMQMTLRFGLNFSTGAIAASTI